MTTQTIQPQLTTDTVVYVRLGYGTVKVGIIGSIRTTSRRDQTELCEYEIWWRDARDRPANGEWFREDAVFADAHDAFSDQLPVS